MCFKDLHYVLFVRAANKAVSKFSLSLSLMHTHSQPHMPGLTQPWNPLRLGDLAKQLIHSAFDLFPIFRPQSANWEKQKRRGDCCMSPRDQTKKRPRDWQKMLPCDGCWGSAPSTELNTGRKLCEWLISTIVLISFTKLCLFLSISEYVLNLYKAHTQSRNNAAIFQLNKPEEKKKERA